jgi:hypothetical protein
MCSAPPALRLPNFIMPRLMNNHRPHRLARHVVRFLGAKAEALGVDIFPGFAGAELLYGPAGAVLGIATGDMGIARDGSRKSGFTRGIELRGKYTLIAEGARGSLAKELIAKFGLDNNREPQNSASAKSFGGSIPPCTGLASSSILSAGRSTIAPAAARSSIISRTTSSPLVSWFT